MGMDKGLLLFYIKWVIHMFPPQRTGTSGRTCHFFANSRRVEEKRRESGIWSYQPDRLASAIPSTSATFHAKFLRRHCHEERQECNPISSSHSLAWQKVWLREGKTPCQLQDSNFPSYCYSTLLFSKHKIQSFLEKATLFKPKIMFCFLDRLVSSSTGLAQALLYPGKCGWSLLILLLGPE